MLKTFQIRNLNNTESRINAPSEKLIKNLCFKTKLFFSTKKERPLNILSKK